MCCITLRFSNLEKRQPVRLTRDIYLVSSKKIIFIYNKAFESKLRSFRLLSVSILTVHAFLDVHKIGNTWDLEVYYIHITPQ